MPGCAATGTLLFSYGLALLLFNRGWTYIPPFFLRDNLGRLASTTMGPSRGPFYYVSVFAIDYFFWSLLALFAVYLLWSKRKTDPPLKSLSYGLPIVWCGLTFLLFSLSKNKQEYYIAPMYPVAAVILSGIMDKTMFRRTPGGAAQDPADSFPGPGRPAASRIWVWPYAFLSFLFFALSILLPYFLRSLMPTIPPVLHYAPSLLFLGVSILTAWSLIRRNLSRCFPALAVSMGPLYMMCALFYLPALESFRPVKDFCRLIEAQAHGEDEAGFYATALPSIAYYLRRPIFQELNPEEMRRRFKSDRRVFCILTDRDYRYFTNDGGLVLYVLDRRSRLAVRMRTITNAGNFPEEELLLVSNRPYSETKSSEDRPIS